MLVSSIAHPSSLALSQELSRERFPPLYLLILEGNDRLRANLKKIARERNFIVSEAKDVATAREMMKRQAVDLLLLDPSLRGDRRESFFEEIKALHPETDVIASTSAKDLPLAIEAIENGAVDYITWPLDYNLVSKVLDRSRQQLYAAIRSRRARERFRSQKGLGGLVGQSPAMQQLRRLIAQTTQSVNPVLLSGEPGAGKELVARSIHFGSQKAASPFLVLDCRSLSPALRGSELFGYARNAFPGAHFEQEGLLTLADTGTILLDEVTELPMKVQTELVRSLRERRIRLVGSKNSTPIAVRVIAATSRDIGAMVDRGRFRKDLHALLNVSSIKVPSLRERPEDIGDLLSYFIDRINRQARMSRSLSSAIIGLLERYTWPGNVRELENAIEYACFHSSNDLLEVRDFPPHIQISPDMADRLAPVPSQNTLPVNDSLVGKSIADIEREAILKTLVFTNGNKLEAAKLLRLGKTTLYRKLKEYGVIEEGS